jgi:hypothetical protein
MTVVPTTVVVFSVFQLFQDLEFDGARGGIAGVLLRLGLALGLFLLLSAITPNPHNPAARQPP